MGEPGFFERVYEIVARIPAGKVATYGQIALLAGRPNGARMVGYAMRSAGGRDLPCHRVVNRTGALAPEHAFGGRDLQRQMLEREGVVFLEDGRINMAESRWKVL